MPLKTLAKDIMTKKVITLHLDDSVFEAANKLAENGITGAPVVDDNGDLVGTMSETDVLNAIKTSDKTLKMVYPSLSTMSVSFIYTESNRKEIMDAFEDLGKKKVGEIMKKRVFTVSPDDSMEKAIEVMNEKKVNRIPVLDDGELVGIITRADIIKALHF